MDRNLRRVSQLALLLPSVASAGQLIVSPTSGIVLDEGGPRFGVSVRLSAPPVGTDTVAVGYRFANELNAGCYSDPNPEIAVSCDSLLFTASTWDQPQTLWLYPNTDLGTFGPGTPVVDGDQDWHFDIEVRSASAGFVSAPPVRIAGTTRDMDQRSLYVLGAWEVLSESTGSTSPVGQNGPSFILTAQPAADVRVEVISSDQTEGGTNVAYDHYTFTPATWASPKTLSLIAIDDPVFDGDRPWSLIASFSSADPDWDGLVREFPMLTLDDESGGVQIAPFSELVTSEDGGLTATFEVTLTEPPWRPVEIGFSPDETEGVCLVETVTFDADTWDLPQTVTVAGVDDPVVDGDVTYVIEVEDWTTAFPLGPELLVNGDFVDGVDGWTGSIGYGEDGFPGGMLTDAVGGYALHQAITDLEPGCEYQITVDTVQLPVTPDLIGTAANQALLRIAHRPVGSVAAATSWVSLWHEGPQTAAYVAQWPETEIWLTVSRQAPGRTQDYLIESVSLKKWRCPTGYELLPPLTVEVTNLDDDTAGFSLAASGGLVSEDGAVASVSPRFTSEPLAPVFVTLFVSDTTEGVLGTTTVVVGSDDWEDVADVFVFGADDVDLDGDVGFIVTAVTSSNDPAYDGLFDAVSFVNQDDDEAAVLVSDGTRIEAPLIVSEQGNVDRFTVRLGARPTAPVNLDLVVDDPSEGAVIPAQVTIAPADWDEAVSIAVRGLDDGAVDGDVGFTLSATTTSTDPAWQGLTVPVLHAVNQDDDTAGLSIRLAGPLGLVQTSEGGGADTLLVALQAAPTANVTVTVAYSDETEATVAPNLLTFTPSNYATPQPVSVTGVDDEEVDGDLLFGVSATAASADGAFDGLVVFATGINRDDDEPEPEPDTEILVDTDSGDTEIVDTEIVDTEIVDTEIVDTEPVDTEPVDTEVADTEPVDTELPDETDLPEDTDTPKDPRTCGCNGPGAPIGDLGWLLALSTLVLRRRR